MQDRIFHKRLDEKLVNPDIFCLFTYIYLTDKSIVEPHFLKADIFFQPVCHLRDGHHLVAFIYAVPENDPQVAQHFANLIFLLFNRHPVDGIQRIVQKMWIDLSLQRPYLRVFLLLCDLSYFCDQILDFSCHGIEIVRDLSHLILSIHMHLNIQITALHLLDSPYNTPCGPLYKANRITYEQNRGGKQQRTDKNGQKLDPCHITQHIIPVICIIKDPSQLLVLVTVHSNIFSFQLPCVLHKILDGLIGADGYAGVKGVGISEHITLAVCDKINRINLRFFFCLPRAAHCI